MNPYFYLLLICVFSLPLMAIVAVRKTRLVKSNLGVIATVSACGVAIQLITEYFGLSWGAWSFSGENILGIWIGPMPVEELLLGLLFPTTLAVVIVVLLEWRKQGKHRWLVGK